LLIIAQLLCIVSSGYALETNTHALINEYIARTTLNGFSLDTHLKDQLRISEGIEVKYDSNKVWWWLRIGGTYEDTSSGCIPYWRCVRHFQNPLTDTGYGPFESSISWSQKSAGSQSCGHYSSVCKGVKHEENVIYNICDIVRLHFHPSYRSQFRMADISQACIQGTSHRRGDQGAD
jgi:hypothetical protein